MASAVGQHQVAQVVSPVAGTSPIDANNVRGNDNSIIVGYDAHDSDGTIHVQDSITAARTATPATGTKWFTLDGAVLRVWMYSGGWVEAAYATTSGAAFTGPVSITSTTTPQFTIAYDGSNSATISVASNGATMFNATGAGAGFTFSDAVTAGTSLAVTTSLTVGTTLGVTGTSALGVVTATDLTVNSSGTTGLANIALFRNSAGTPTGVRLATNQTTAYAHVAAYANGAAAFGLKLQYQNGAGTATDAVTISSTDGAAAFAAGLSATTGDYSDNISLVYGKAIKSTDNAAASKVILTLKTFGAHVDTCVLGDQAAHIGWGVANAALGGGAAATLGTIGGSGPASAAQAAWAEMIDSSGTKRWFPVWS